ncbi:MAG: ribosomal protein L7/L12 [Bacteroidales bacterium]|nr:ribosomal protein L7/L12 [Bacteroidales bacterium]
MITLSFIPGASKLRVIKAIKCTTHCLLREAKDAVDLQRVNCEPKQRDALIKAIEKAGGKVM